MNIQQTILKNGLKLINIKKKDSEVAVVLFLVGVGSAFETKQKAGISHFLEHLFFKGTTRRKNSLEISEFIEEIGGSFNAFTSKEYTGYYAEVAKKHVDKAFDFVSDLMLHPLFPKEEIEKEKNVVIEEMNMYQDMPMQYVGEKFEELLYGDTPSGRLVIGSKKSVMGLTREDLVKYVRSYYAAKNGVLVFVGNKDIKSVKKLSENYFAELKKGTKGTRKKVQEKQAKPKVSLLTKKTDQTHLCLGFRTVPLNTKEYYTAKVFAVALGGGMSSRLFTEIREKRGLCYYIRASQQSYLDSGYLVVQAGIDNTKVDEAVKATLAEIVRVKKEGLTKKELGKVKEFIKGKLALSLETSQSTAIYMAERYVLQNKIEELEKQYARIDAVTLSMVQSFMDTYIQEKSLNLTLIGPFKDRARFVKMLTLK
ncbi:insulinase family protein [Patescibacteria group bacterium]|nr:insulinase family protein [Patescibacteria group bacterium]